MKKLPEASRINKTIIVTTCLELDLRIEEKLKETFKKFREVTKLRRFVGSKAQAKRICDKFLKHNAKRII